MLFREMGPDDQTQLERLALIALTRANRQQPDAKEIATWTEDWGLRPEDLGVGYEEHGLKGACWSRGKGEALIALAEPLRGRGIGGDLLDHLIKEMEDQGMRSISMSVRQDNQAALGLLQSRGFGEQGLDPQGRQIMRLELPAKPGF